MGAAILPGSEAAGVFGVPHPDAGEEAWTPERGVLRALKIPPLALLVTVLALAAGELACGTQLYFVTMMAVALLSIGITYNMLGGLSRIGGVMFAALAAQRIVISQFAKVILHEPADHNLEVPYLTITVYAVFFLSAMVGVFLFGNLRPRLPRPWEPRPGAETRLLYFVSLIGGVVASVIFWIDQFGNIEQTDSLSNGFALVFQSLLLFSIVLAIDDRIQTTEGRHSLGVWVVVSCLAAEFFAYLQTSRMGEAIPVVTYFLSCYVRGYRFRKKHYVAGILFAILLQTVFSPVDLYMRGFMYGLSFRERITRGYEFLQSPPTWAAIQYAQLDAQTSNSGDEYYSAPNTFVLSRFSLIRADSDLIAACSNGFRYGFRALKMDLLREIPRIFYRNKPELGAELYIESLVGVGGSGDTAVHWAFTSVSDAFGALGWLGVVLFPLFVLPALFVVYDTMFDMTRPWGTVALAGAAVSIAGAQISQTLMLMIKEPIYFWVLSVLTVGMGRFLVGSGEHTLPSRSLRNRNNSDALHTRPQGATTQ